MKYLCYILFLCFPFTVFCQVTPEKQRAIDSLQKVILSGKHDTTIINAYKTWDNIIYISDPKLDMELNRKIVRLAEQNLRKSSLNGTEKKFFHKNLSYGYNNIGSAHMRLGEFDRALGFYRSSIKMQEEIADKKGLANTYNNMGSVYARQADYVNSIAYFTKSLKLMEELGNKNGIGSALNNIGIIYNDLGDPAKAREYLERSLKIKEETGDKFQQASALNNIGLTYKGSNDHQKALECFEKSLKISEEINDQEGIAISLNNMANIYDNLGQLEKAIEQHLKSLKLREEIGDKFGIASSLNNLGGISRKQKNFKKAIEYSKKALEIAKEAGLVQVMRDASTNLIEAYRKQGDYKLAFEMMELNVAMRDSIRSETSQKEVMKQEMQYNYEKQKALDEKELEKRIAVSAEQEQKQKVITYSIAAGLILVLLFAVFVVNRLRLTRKQKRIIEQQKELVDTKQKEIIDSISYAKRLQEAILPSESFVKQLLPSSFTVYIPKDIVAGDFYWVEQKHDIIFIAAADCTGHGVPGAMVSVVCSNALNRSVLEFGITEPGKILDQARELVLETFARNDQNVKDGMDISLISISKTNKTVHVKWAGANNPLWYISGGKMHEIVADKQAIGQTESPKPFTTHILELKEGDTLFLLTDGYADQFGGERGKKFKYKPLKEMLLNNIILSMEDQKLELNKAFEKWKGSLEQVDDVCIIGLRL